MNGTDGYSATEISEMLLEMTGNAMLEKDFEAFARCFHLPHILETPDEKTVLKTRVALRALFDRVTHDHADRNVNNLIRICEVAEFRGPFRVEATHITHLMSGTQRVADPFPTFSVLEYIDNRWQITSSQYAVDRNINVGRAFSMGPFESETPARGATRGSGSNERKN